MKYLSDPRYTVVNKTDMFSPFSRLSRVGNYRHWTSEWTVVINAVKETSGVPCQVPGANSRSGDQDGALGRWHVTEMGRWRGTVTSEGEYGPLGWGREVLWKILQVMWTDKLRPHCLGAGVGNEEGVVGKGGGTTQSRPSRLWVSLNLW